jgi:hypothetical protein
MEISIIGENNFELDCIGYNLGELFNKATDHLLTHNSFINKVTINDFALQGDISKNSHFPATKINKLEFETCSFNRINPSNFQSAEYALGVLFPPSREISKYIHSGDFDCHKLLISNLVPLLIKIKTLENAQSDYNVQEEDNQSFQNLSSSQADMNPEQILQQSLKQSFHVGIPDEGINLKKLVEGFEKELVIEALEKTGWVKNKAATLLNLNRTTLVEKCKKMKIEPNKLL